MEKNRVMAVFGTRPEAIKMCPLIRELYIGEKIKITVCITGQHTAMTREVLSSFSVRADRVLCDIPKGSDLGSMHLLMTEGVVRAIKEYSPDLILIHGDTLSAFCAGIAAFFEGIPIGHVEAGLRTDSRTPYPEEFCRRSIAAMADYHFAPTSRARENLLREGVPDGGIFVCGNTVVDALRYTLRRDFSSQILDKTCGAPFILITSHRRESLGAPMLSMLRAVADALREYPLVKAIFPLHPNPEVRRIARSALSGLDNVIFTEPVGVVEFHNILAECGFVLTDSGGIQEEAAALGKVALVMREHTEREEGVGGFGIRAVGTDPREIYAALSSALATCERRRTIAIKENPFGDGFASRRIADAIESVLK